VAAPKVPIAAIFGFSLARGRNRFARRRDNVPLVAKSPVVERVPVFLAGDPAFTGDAVSPAEPGNASERASVADLVGESEGVNAADLVDVSGLVSTPIL